jgi:hypothetical protein
MIFAGFAVRRDGSTVQGFEHQARCYAAQAVMPVIRHAPALHSRSAPGPGRSWMGRSATRGLSAQALIAMSGAVTSRGVVVVVSCVLTPGADRRSVPCHGEP